jgi:hypothetical protein
LFARFASEPAGFASFFAVSSALISPSCAKALDTQNMQAIPTTRGIVTLRAIIQKLSNIS